MRMSGSGSLRAAGALVALCSLAMLPVTTLAYTPEQQQACTGDAFRLCSSDSHTPRQSAKIPDVDRITACMIRNKTQLSAEGRAQFGPPPGAPVGADDPPTRPPGSKPSAKRKAASANRTNRKSRQSTARADLVLWRHSLLQLSSMRVDRRKWRSRP